jgi:hypothetical protein
MYVHSRIIYYACMHKCSSDDTWPASIACFDLGLTKQFWMLLLLLLLLLFLLFATLRVGIVVDLTRERLVSLIFGDKRKVVPN